MGEQGLGFSHIGEVGDWYSYGIGSDRGSHTKHRLKNIESMRPKL